MTRIFDALKKAHVGHPSPPVLHPAPPPPALHPATPPDLGVRGLRPVPVRGEPARGGAAVDFRPHVISIAPALELPGEVVREMTRLRVSIESLLMDRGSRCVMFVSSQGHEGTSTVAYQFAFTLARDTRVRTLYVDAHAHRPSLHGEEGARPAAGRGRGRSRPLHSTGAPPGTERALDAWPLGEQFHEIGLLSPALVRQAIDWGSSQYDWMVFDGPPVLESSDAAPIAAITDGVVIVVEAGRTKRPVLQRSVELLRKAGGHVMGSVLNRRRLEIPGFIYRRI
jgi:Mrp family chromosome partitioning ATPase